MHRTRPGGWAACALVVAAALAGAASAWACVPQPRLVTLKPAFSGPAGSEVTVEGLGFDVGPIEVRWAASDGPTLARTTGESFSVTATVPDVPPGLYAIIVLSRGSDGSVGNTGAAAYEVTRPAGGGDPIDTASSPPPRQPTERSTDAGVVVLAALGGAALTLVGGLVGAALTRRRAQPA